GGAQRSPDPFDTASRCSRGDRAHAAKHAGLPRVPPRPPADRSRPAKNRGRLLRSAHNERGKERQDVGGGLCELVARKPAVVITAMTTITNRSELHTTPPESHGHARVVRDVIRVFGDPTRTVAPNQTRPSQRAYLHLRPRHLATSPL